MSLTDEQVKQQSLNAYRQWRQDWINNAKHNKKYLKTSIYDGLKGIGSGKTLLVLANGPSLGKHWDLIKQYRHKLHIACVDKAFKPLMERGIKPDYVILCDANVNFKEYCDGLDTTGIALLANMCAEKNWVAYWKGPIFFFINKDSIQTEHLFTAISEYAEYIPAASNVSNALIMVAHFVLRYDINLMTGYDYSWQINEYYSDGPTDKECWMATNMYSDITGNLVRTSNNLVFSAKWIGTFFESSKIRNFVNCSEQGLMYGVPQSELKKQLERLFKEPAAFAA